MNNIPLSNLTSDDVVHLIGDDARDTLSKLLSTYQLFMSLAAGSAGDSMDIEGLDEFFAEMPASFTWVDAELDIIHVELDPESRSVYNVLSSGERRPLVQNGIITATTIVDLAGDEYTTLEALALLGDQIQVSEVISRLASLAASGSVDSQAVSTALADMLPQLTGEAKILVTAITGLGSNLNPLTLTRVLSSVYSMYSTAQPSDEETRITFMEDTYTVKAYFGTVVEDVLLTASEIISDVLLVAGGVVAKILGLIGKAICFVASKIDDRVESASTAQVDILATHQELIKPIGQVRIMGDWVPTATQNLVDQYGVIEIKLPAFNLYIWREDADYFGIEAYASVMHTGAAYNGVAYNGVKRQLFYVDYVGEPSQHQLRVSVDNDGANTTFTRNFPFAEAIEYTADFVSELAGAEFKQMDDVSDDAARRRVWYGILMAAWQLYQIRHFEQPITAIDNDGTFATSTYIDGEYRYVIGQATDAWVTEWQESLSTKEFIPDWSVIINNIVPELQSAFNVLEVGTWRALLGEGSLFWASSVLPWMRPNLNYRASFAVVPPAYSKSALISSIIISAVATAAMTALTVAAVTVAKRKIRKWLTNRTGDLENMWKDWNDPASPHYRDDSLLETYLRKSRLSSIVSSITGSTAVLPTAAGFTAVGANAVSAGAAVETLNSVVDYIPTELSLLDRIDRVSYSISGKLPQDIALPNPS